MGMLGLESAAANVQVSLKSYARTGTPSEVCLISYFQKAYTLALLKRETVDPKVHKFGRK